MADDLNINVTLQKEVENLRNANTRLSTSPNYTGEVKSKAQFNLSQLDKLSKQEKFTNEDLRNFKKYFKELTGILTNIALKEKMVSKEFEDAVKKMNDITTKLEKARDKVTKLSEKVAVDEKGQTRLRSSYIGEAIEGITYKGGRHDGKQVGAEAFFKGGNRPKTDTFSEYNDPERAQQIYWQLKEDTSKLPSLYKKAVEAVQALEQALAQMQQSAETLKTTGDQETAIDLSTSSDNVSKGITKYTEETQKQKEIKYKSTELKELNEEQQKQNSTLGKAFKSFSLYAIALKTAKKLLKEVTTTVIQLDKSLTEQAMVTGLTRQQTYKLLQSYQDLASQTGATTKEVAGVATEYMKQGKSVTDALKLTEAAVSAAKIAGISTADSVNYLTTALNGFRLSADDAMSVSDKFAAVAASSATDYDELAIALSKVASQANLAGMSIDYTTALLAKGLETTREAPETMGTALKTIIARMREMSDYGSTLEGDTDVNNVETQLAYVDIALKNTNGELRSTEDVLDELGRKWDTLSTNQQAAIAKALAGTRQQSRLIAMMDDYDRVIELQQISARSAGATSAQAATYLEGIEASINTISVAVEKLISTFSDSEVINSVLDSIGSLLEWINDVLNNKLGMELVLAGVALVLSQMVASKAQSWAWSVKENAIQKEITKQQLFLKKTELERKKIQADSLVKSKEDLLVDKQKEHSKRRQAILDNKNLTSEQKEAQLKEEDAAWAQEEVKAQEEIAQAKLDANKINLELTEVQRQQDDLTRNTANSVGNIAQTIGIIGGGIGSLISGSQTWLVVMTAIGTAIKIVNGLIKIGTALKEKDNKKTAIGALLAAAKNAFSSIPVAGLIIGAAILAAAGIGIAVSAAVNKAKTGQNTAEEIKGLNKEIYDLTKQADSLKTIETKFDAIDNKIIKTKEDLKEMKDLLTSAGDSMDDTEVDDKEDIGYGKGMSQKEFYEGLATDKQKREFLAQEENKARQQINEKYLKSQQKIASMRSKGQLKRFLNGTSQEAIATRDSIYGWNNNQMYSVLDDLEAQGKIDSAQVSEIQSWTQAILENIDAEEADRISQTNLVQSFTKTVASLRTLTETTGEYVNALDVLSSSDYSLKEQVKAYNQIKDTITDPAILQSFEETYKQMDFYASQSEAVLEFLDQNAITAEKLEKLNNGYKKLNSDIISQTEYQGTIRSLLNNLGDVGGDIEQALHMSFDNILDTLDPDAWEETWTGLVNIMEEVMGTGLTNMGQLIEKELSRIDDFYEKTVDWSAMKVTDRMSFIQDNADMFAGEQGAELLDAFESQDYERIQEALASNEYLNKQRTQLLQKARVDLELEQMKTESEQNKAYIKILEEYIDQLEDTESLYQADLEVRLKKQENQLSEFKDMLESQQEALEKSLEKRKEAYENYYNAINETEEDRDYETEATRIQSNLTKLASSTDASAATMRKELEKSLQDLEEERLKTLRERAQEAVLESMDNELEEIKNKFDEVLNNQAALLNLFNQQIQNPEEFLSNLIINKAGDGQMTQLQLEDWLSTFKSLFSGTIDTDILNSLSASTDASGNLTINIDGDEVVNVSQKDGKALAEALKQAIIQYGGGIVNVRK